MGSKQALLLGVLLGAASLCCWGADDPPSWLREIATVKPPSYAAKVPAVVLLDEQQVTLEEGGRVTTTTRKAIRILNKEGRKQAHGIEQYFASGGKVKDMRAWVLYASGDSKKFGKERVIESGLGGDDSLYEDYRRKMISATAEADEGSVFGYESVVEEKTAFTQFVYPFQSHLPVLTSRFRLQLPAGWRADGVTFNHAQVTPDVAGSTYTWELKQLPPVEEEESGPTHSAIVPRLAVTSFPGDGAKLGIQKSVPDWTELSRWMSEISDPQSTPTEELTAKARELTANAKTDFEKVQAIGTYVQAIRYVAIQTNLARGGGYKPHPAGEVFQKRYGDCKDKANLMKAMLQAVNVRAHHLSIYSGDRTYVRQEWASPYQFNHDIVAVELKGEVTAPAVVTHPQLGKLLIFDPTDPYTPVGDLPEHEQGSWALLVAGDQGKLLRMPATPPAANRLERETDVVLSGEGAVTVKSKEQSYGQSAVRMRARLRQRGKPEFDKSVERWVSHGATSAKVEHVEVNDAMAEGQFGMNLEFTAERYGQLMQNRLLVFKPAVLTRREGVSLKEDKRSYPVVLDAEAFRETVRIQLPAKFKVDEMPDKDVFETPFGKYSASWEEKDGTLIFKRSLEVQSTTLAADKYGEVKKFFERVYGADGAPVVLVRQ